MTIRANELQAIALWAAVVPLVTINVCFVVAVNQEHLPACVPYISGCTSVSSTGRIAPESLIFRAGMLPSAVLLAIFWHQCSIFLELGGQSGSRLPVIRLLGAIAAMSLTVYALTLGFEDHGYPQARQAGIYGFAFSTFAAETMFISSYRHLRTKETAILWRWLVVLCLALPLLGIISELAKLAGEPRRATNNIVAWNAFVAASAYYAVVARIWHRHGFSGEYRLESTERKENKSSGRPTSPSE